MREHLLDALVLQARGELTPRADVRHDDFEQVVELAAHLRRLHDFRELLHHRFEARNSAGLCRFSEISA